MVVPIVPSRDGLLADTSSYIELTNTNIRGMMFRSAREAAAFEVFRGLEI
jgi:hypothetical protein